MAKTENVETAVEVKTATKKNIFGEAFEKEYNQRVKMLLEDIAPRVLEAMEAYGLLSETGFYYDHQAVHFEYNALTNILSIDTGANPVVRANLSTKRVTVFRNGAWLTTFEQWYQNAVEGRDIVGIKRNKEVKIRDMMGMSKI